MKVVRDATGKDYVFTVEGKLVVGKCEITIEIDPHGDAVTDVTITLPDGQVWDYAPYEVVDTVINPMDYEHYDPTK
ncbi:MAG: hypothetical protein RLO50_06165 [Azospirillaceae bacterium]